MYFFISHPAIFKQMVKKRITTSNVHQFQRGKSLLIVIIQMTPENNQRKKTNFGWKVPSAEQNFKIIFLETLKCANLQISNNCNSTTVYPIVMTFCMNINETFFQGAMSFEFLISHPNLNYASLCADWLDFGYHGN